MLFEGKKPKPSPPTDQPKKTELNRFHKKKREFVKKTFHPSVTQQTSPITVSQSIPSCTIQPIHHSFVKNMHRTTPPPLNPPPIPNTLAMELTQTLQPPHLLPSLKLLHADRALLLPALAVNTVLLRSDVRENASRAVGHGARAGDRRRVRVRRWGVEGGGQVGVVGVCGRDDGAEVVGDVRRCWDCCRVRGRGGEAAADAGLHVGFAEGVSGGEFDAADGAFVFFGDLAAAFSGMSLLLWRG